MQMFKYIRISDKYNVRKEKNKVIIFSGFDRKLHYLDHSAYTLLEEAENKSFDDLISEFQPDEQELARGQVATFFTKLRDEGIIEFINSE